MFNLVGKRYWFLIISLIIIVPGTISLLVKGLNVGLDFANGSSIELRPQKTITETQASNILKPLKLENLQVITGDNNIPGNQTVWIRLNTKVDDSVVNIIKSDLQKKYGSQLSVAPDDLAFGIQNVTVVTVSTFNQGTTPQISDIRQILNNLPKTTNAASATPGITTPTVAPYVTPTVGSPKPTGKSMLATTPPHPTTDTPLGIVAVTQGTTTQTITILTSSVANLDNILKIKSLMLNDGKIYVQNLRTASVSPSVASETTRNAILAVVAASVLILLYVWFAFRKVNRPWRYGACAIIALLHDVLVVLGVFSILGWTVHIQISALFITALLTVVGFSVHDTIVVFDRIRENMQRRTSETFDEVVNASLVQTMARSLNTSLTVLFTLSALTLFGGTTIRDFTLALLVGIFSGTYSSIFNASMLLVIWEKGELGLDRFNREYTADGRSLRELARSRG